MTTMRANRFWTLAFAVLWGALLGWVCGPEGQAAWADANVQWAWMSGFSYAAQHGTFGSQGVPAATNTPGGRNGGVSWTDSSGRLWIFGGDGFDGGSSWHGFLNDLWLYDPVTGYWTWMKGANGTNQAGTYGTIKVAVETNTPGGRQAASSWTFGIVAERARMRTSGGVKRRASSQTVPR